MKTIDIKEIKKRGLRLLQKIWGKRIMTLDGEPTEVRRPSQDRKDAKSHSEHLETAMLQSDLLAEKLAKSWPDGVSAADAVAEQRR